MDEITIGAIMALLEAKIPGFTAATEAALEAAAGAQAYADQYYGLSAALNLYISSSQAEIRDLCEQVKTLSAQVAALQG